MARTIDWIDIIVLNWLVFHYSGDVMYLSYINAARLLPSLLLVSIIGRLVDCRRMTELMYIVQAAIIGVTVLIYMVNVQSIFLLIVLVTVKSIFVSLDNVQRNKLLPTFAGKEKLEPAIQLNALILNCARLAGPFIAGLCLAYVDPVQLLILPACGALCVILLNRSLPDVECGDIRQHQLKPYLQQRPQLIGLILSSLMMMFFGLSISVILPVIAGSSHLYALYTAVLAAGSILTLLPVFRMNVSDNRKIYCSIMMTIIGCCGLLISGFWTALLSLFVIGAATQSFRTINRVLIQRQTIERYRGSVLAVAMMDRGFIPLGGVVLTFIIKHYNLTAALFLMIAGLTTTLCCTYYWMRRSPNAELG
ncbi:MFS transporter [Macrococcus brunensis]|uniref:MFS transporter n=1 Tax=Macrococcus brunensis TaxID=198483 RepID=UPI001EF019A7|nr:MFS transporter [Macrococcus brunensis]ULG72245.1 MFS transporter [Macrococcus brunensis]